MTIELGALTAVATLQLILLWRMFVDRRAVAKLDARLARQGEALALLTETSEVGFGAVARELERLGSAPVKASRKPTTRRIATQARKGRTVTEIAADEQISEGEVSLRLHLAGYPGAMEDASCRAVHTSR